MKKDWKNQYGQTGEEHVDWFLFHNPTLGLEDAIGFALFQEERAIGVRRGQKLLCQDRIRESENIIKSKQFPADLCFIEGLDSENDKIKLYQRYIEEEQNRIEGINDADVESRNFIEKYAKYKSNKRYSEPNEQYLAAQKRREEWMNKDKYANVVDSATGKRGVD